MVVLPKVALHEFTGERERSLIQKSGQRLSAFMFTLDICTRKGKNRGMFCGVMALVSIPAAISRKSPSLPLGDLGLIR